MFRYFIGICTYVDRNYIEGWLVISVTISK